MMIHPEVVENLAAERDLWKKEFMAMKDEVDRLSAELKEREGEVGRIRKTYDSQMDILRKRVESLLLDKEFLTSNVNHAESLAASLLTDQEAIERRVTKRVAGEGAENAETFRTPYGSHPLLSGVQIGAVIRNKYGAE